MVYAMWRKGCVYEADYVTKLAEAAPKIVPTSGTTQFVNPSTGNFSLSASSPALNTGDPTTIIAQISLADLGCCGGRIDMGAFEFLPVLCRLFTLKLGIWTDPTVWSCGRIPLAVDPIELRHSITVPTALTVSVQKLRLQQVVS